MEPSSKIVIDQINFLQGTTMDAYLEKAGGYLRHLCLDIPTRLVGTAGNRAATDFFERTATAWAGEPKPNASTAWITKQEISTFRQGKPASPSASALIPWDATCKPNYPSQPASRNYAPAITAGKFCC
jgi:hypothetical protein